MICNIKSIEFILSYEVLMHLFVKKFLSISFSKYILYYLLLFDFLLHNGVLGFWGFGVGYNKIPVDPEILSKM